MAETARRQLKADGRVAVTAVAGLDPLEGKSPRLAYICIVAKKIRSIEGRYPLRRVDVKRLLVTHTLSMLRQKLASS